MLILKWRPVNPFILFYSRVIKHRIAFTPIYLQLPSYDLTRFFYGYTDILFTMTGPHVVARSQVPVPVVLPSPLASTPAAATPASVCCLTQHDIAWENSADISVIKSDSTTFCWEILYMTNSELYLQTIIPQILKP